MPSSAAERLRSHVLFVLLAVAAGLSFFIFRPFLIPLALAAIFAVALQPLFKFFCRKLATWRGLAALATIIVSAICLLAPLFLVGVLMFGEIERSYVGLTQGPGLTNIQQSITRAGESLNPYIPGSSTLASSASADLNRYANLGFGWIVGHLGAAFSSFLGFVLDLFIFLLGLYVFLKDGPRIRAGLLALSPFKDGDDEFVLDRLTLTVNSVVRGKLVLAVLQGLAASVGFFIFGIPNPLLWGLMTSIAGLVPGIGTTLVMAPVILYSFVTAPLTITLGLLVWAIGVGLIDNVLGPYLMKKGLAMPQLVILLSVLGGLIFFGPAGIFLGPLTISLLLALFSLYAEAGKKRSTS